MRGRTVFYLSVLAGIMLLLVSATASAQGKGEGGIVLRDGAPVYVSSTGTRTEATLKRGDAVAGITTSGIIRHYEFEEDDGRLHVYYFRPPKYEGIGRTAWMDPQDVARFFYDCGCDTDTTFKQCVPYSQEVLTRRWNACFREARDNKLAELRLKWTPESTAAQASPPAQAQPPVVRAQTPAEKPLINDDVAALVKLELGDDIVIAKIQQAPSEALDVSTDALIKLKSQGVSKEVLDAMIKRAAKRTSELGEQRKAESTKQPPTSEVSAASVDTVKGRSIKNIWRGEVAESGSPSYPVIVTLAEVAKGERCGSTSYPSLKCEGSLTCYDVQEGKYFFKEKIEKGKLRCVGGVIQLTRLDEKTLRYEWFFSAGGKKACEGLLHPEE